jgi:ATP phosphoribosyltransferase regulatory subunit
MTLLTGAGFGTDPERTALKNKIEQELRILFGKYGYNEISLPVYEYYSILKNTGYRFLDQHLISFTDVSSGRMLVLRPDFTPQVSRLVAGYKDSFPLPIRLSYGGPVFRNADIQHGAKAEKYHLGCELYGAPEKEGDKEMLLLVTAAADRVKTDFTLLIGDAFYLARLSSLLGDCAAEYFDILKSKKLYKIKDFVTSLSASLSQDASALLLLVSKLPSLFGGVEAARELNALSAFDPELSKRSEYLISLFSDVVSLGISADRLLFDPAEILDLNYYTGITFELFHRTSGTALGGGGRYDTLMKNFALELTACGFSLYLEEMADASGFESERIKADYLALGEKSFMKAEELRRAGYTVISVYDEKEADAFSTFADVKNIIR